MCFADQADSPQCSVLNFLWLSLLLFLNLIISSSSSLMKIAHLYSGSSEWQVLICVFRGQARVSDYYIKYFIIHHKANVVSKIRMLNWLLYAFLSFRSPYKFTSTIVLLYGLFRMFHNLVLSSAYRSCA